jgi:hypothetical protein
MTSKFLPFKMPRIYYSVILKLSLWYQLPGYFRIFIRYEQANSMSGSLSTNAVSLGTTFQQAADTAGNNLLVNLLLFFRSETVL